MYVNVIEALIWVLPDMNNMGIDEGLLFFSRA